MFKTITHLPMRIATLLMLVVMFATGMTASAEHFHVDFKQPNATSFTDGDLLVTSDDLASTLEGLVLNSSTTVTFQTDRPGLEGIGRIVFNAAPGTNNDDLELLASSCGFSFHRGQFTASGSHLIVTPSSTEELRNRAEVNLIYSRLVMGSRRVVFESVDVYTGVLASNSSPEEYTTEGYTMTGVFNCFDAFYRAKNAPGSRWNSCYFGNDLPLTANHYYRNSNASVALYVAHEGGIRFYNNCLILCRDAQFSICAPAGYAIKSIRFVSVDLNVLYGDFGWGTQDLSCIKSNSGRMSGTMDRIWTADAGSAEAGSVQFYVNDDSSPYIDHIVATMEPIACGASSTDTRFNVTADMTWPRGHAEVIHGGYENPSFWYTVHPADGITFTSVAEAPEVKMTLDNGNVLYPATTGGLYEGNAVFTFTLPEDLVRRPFGATFEFPEGVISAGADHNRAFSRHLHVRPTAFYDVTGVMTSDPSANPFELYGYTDVDLYGDRNNTPGTYSQFQFYFTGYTQAQGELSWTYGEPLAPSDVIFTDADGGRLDIASVELGTDASGDYCLTVTLRQPITESNMGRYRLTIPEGVVITKNGYTNRRIDVGYNFYVSDSEPLSTIPAQNSWVKSLGKVIYYLPSRSLQLDEEQVEVDYALGGEWQTMTVTASIDEQGRGVLTFPQPITASDIANFVMSGMKGNPFLVDGKQPRYTTFGCTIDTNISLVSSGFTDPQHSEPVPADYFAREGIVYMNNHGFFISYNYIGDYLMTDEYGTPLNHGNRIWRDNEYINTKGFLFTYQGEKSEDKSGWKWQYIVYLNEGDTKGIFVPMGDIDAGKYHLVIPEGLIKFKRNSNGSQAINNTIDITWEVVNCAEDGDFRIVYPAFGATVKTLDKVIVEYNPESNPVARTYIEGYPETTSIGCYFWDVMNDGTKSPEYLGEKECAATTSLNDKGQLVFTFDEPIAVNNSLNGGNPVYTTLLFNTGLIRTNEGLYNRNMEAGCYIDSNIQYRNSNITAPDCNQVQPLSEYAYEGYRLGVNYHPNIIDYDSSNIKYYLNPETQGRRGVILYDEEIGFPKGYSFINEKTGEDLTASTNVHVGYGGCEWVLYFSVGPDIQPGTYHVQFPAGAVRFQDGKYNDEIDYTWTLVGTIPEEMIKVVYPSERNEAPFDHLEIAYNADTFVPVITPVADEINNLWLAQYADYEGQQMITLCADGQHAKLSVNEQGNLIVQLDHMIDNAGMVNVEVAPSTFFDQNGNANPNLQLSFAPRCYELGWPNVSNNDLVKNLSEFQITVRDGGREHPIELAPVADDYAINFSVELYDDSYNYKESVDLGAHTGCITSIAKNDEGRNVITVSVPDVVQGRIAEQTGNCELRVYLPGYNPDENGKPAMAIRTTGGLPNREALYDFRIKPDLSYNCFFSMLDMPEGVTILFDGYPIAYTANGFFIEECDDPITPDRFSFEGLPEGVECKITIEGGTQAKGILDFTRYAKIESYPFMNNTVEQSEFAASASFNFFFDRELDSFSEDTMETLNYCISGINFTDFQAYSGGWSGAGGNWFGFGFDTWSTPNTTFPAGDYRVSIPARIFQFKDGSWNPAIDYDFTITSGVTFRIANHAVTYYTDNGLAFQKPNTTGTTNPFCNIALYFDGQTVKADDFEFSYDTTSKYIDVNVLDPNTGSYDPKRAKVILNYDAEKEQQVLVLRLDDLLLPPYAMVSIPEGALTTRDGRTNKQYDMWFNIMEEGHKTLMLYVDGELSYDASISYQVPGTAETFYAASYHDVDAQNWTNIQIVGPSYLIISDEDYDDELNRVNLWLATDPDKAYASNVKATATVDCQGGLRDAVVKFQKPGTKVGALPITITPDADLIRERIEWSEGFKLFYTMTPATGRPRDVTVTTDIAYVTTEVDADSKQLILHFFDAEGNDFCPFDDLKKKPTYLTIPVEKLFKSSALWTSSSKTVTVELTYSDVEIVTDNTAYDEVANTTVPGKIGSLSDIILGHRRNGARTNDLDGNGDISIGDIVRLIKRAQ
ncbi:MAG: hypothetical protein Q4D23_06110 [Bacteroidales bacterium]|nr:hypothetical protein [Bacteroidales bacterium]